MREIVSFEDFKELDSLDSQLSALNEINKPWRFINPNCKSIPRPLTTVYTSERGFSEYFVISLDSKSILKSLWANEKIANAMKGFIGESEEEILEKLNKEIKKIKKFLDFEIMIGINVHNTLELLNGEEMTPNDMLSYLLVLVDKYKICYIENPLSDRKLCAEFLSCVKQMSLVVNDTYNGNINNAYILELENLFEMRKNVETLKSLRITPLIKYVDKLSLQLCCGFGVNIFKYDSLNVLVISQQLERLITEIKGG